MAIADPGVSSWTPINIWAMLRALINNNVPFLTIAGAPTSGTSGSFVGQAGPGTLLIDFTNAILYINTNTLASPTWTKTSLNAITGDVTVAAGVSAIGAGVVTEAQLKVPSSFGLGAVRYAKSVYDFAVDGGAVSAILPVKGATLPINAILIGALLDIVTTFTSDGSATLALGTSAGSAANSILAATPVASLTVGITTSLNTRFKMTAAGVLQWTIATAAMTAGKAGLILAYLVGD
jgi:hypothetical protein